MLKTVALYEFLRIVRSKTFLMSLIAIPLALTLPGMIIVGSALFERTSKGADQAASAAVLDQSGLLEGVEEIQAAGAFSTALITPWHLLGAGSGAEMNLAPRPFAVRHLKSFSEGKELLAKGELESFVVIPADYIKKGEMRVYMRQWSIAFGSSVHSFLHDMLVQRLGQRTGLSKDELARIVLEPKVRSYQIGSEGKLEPFSPLSQVLKFFIPLILTGVFFLAVSGCYDAIALTVTREKRSKLVEILLASASAEAILFGKVLGVLAAGLLKLVLWFVLLGSIPAAVLLWFGERIECGIPWNTLLLSLPFAACGVLLFGTVYAGLAFLIDREQGAKFPVVLIVLISGAPFFCFTQFILSPHGFWPRVFSLVPIFSPIGMPARLAFAGTVPLEDLLLSFALLLMTVLAAVKLGAKLFRIAIAGQGESLGILTLMKALVQPNFFFS